MVGTYVGLVVSAMYVLLLAPKNPAMIFAIGGQGPVYYHS